MAAHIQVIVVMADCDIHGVALVIISNTKALTYTFYTNILKLLCRLSWKQSGGFLNLLYLLNSLTLPPSGTVNMLHPMLKDFSIKKQSPYFLFFI